MYFSKKEKELNLFFFKKKSSICTLKNEKSTKSPLFKKKKNSICTFQNEKKHSIVLFKTKKSVKTNLG